MSIITITFGPAFIFISRHRKLSKKEIMERIDPRLCCWRDKLLSPGPGEIADIGLLD